MIIFIEIYLIGFIMTLIFLSKFGKKLGMDYSQEKTYVDYDDYDSNLQAYTVFSLTWPLLWIAGIIVGSWKLLTLFGSLFIKD